MNKSNSRLLHEHTSMGIFRMAGRSCCESSMSLYSRMQCTVEFDTRLPTDQVDYACPSADITTDAHQLVCSLSL